MVSSSVSSASIASTAPISPRSMPRTVTSRISSARGIFKATRLRLDALDDGRRAHLTPPEPASRVRRRHRSRASAADDAVARAREHHGLGIAGRRRQKLPGFRWAGSSRFSPRPSSGRWEATSAPSSKMRISSARTCTSKTRRRVVSGTL